ncbi:hypothetical protein BDM02DRAFT_3155622 [Thelephora ganbajun]|uniref:Uncharacterized protein n=1 Tax=Thelephora ganbajun TaxID=370292 RepID=A0ACB6ZGI1_THEGA|nr:hypothetical protein BDM02DRAFT_3155622 [Thelephora ganbajun]
MIHLPRVLLEEISSSTPAHSGIQRTGLLRRSKGRLSRKDNRRLERIESKKRRAEYHATKQHQQYKRPAREEHEDVPVAKKPRVSAPPPEAKVSNPKPKKRIPLQKIIGDSPDYSSLPRTQEEGKEDAYIRYLEGKLGWTKDGTKTSTYGSGLADDGLDELLTDLDTFESSAGEGPELDPGFADELDVNESISQAEEGNTNTESDDEDYGEWTGFGQRSEPDEDTVPPPVKPQETATTMPTPQPGSKYAPPHLRKVAPGVQSQSSESLVKLTRQLKGLLNRLSEQNISSILDGVEETYRNHSRNDITSTLTNLILDGISSNTTHLESYVVLYAALVAGLYRMIGIEFAAYFVQSTVSAYEKHTRNSRQDQDEPGKEASNLIVLVSELYNFQVISCILIYDLVRDLLNQPRLSEYNVELLLKIVRTTEDSGLQLRQDDPSALRDIIQMVHTKAPERSTDTSSRTKFMIETLSNLKNNKVKKAIGGGANGTGAQEAVERLKKFLSGMNKKRHAKPHEPLRITLEDLHSAEDRGKWWLVGAAWNGDPLSENKENPTRAAAAADRENNLLKLARKQGMNTDIRRSIFVVLMSSEDYMDACERLGQLNLTEVQQREIVRVLLHCCGNEKVYNPYYTLVCQELCRFSHSYKITLQFCLWDFLRELGESNVGGVELLKHQDELAFSSQGRSISHHRLKNTARAYSWWVAKGCCSLTIFKASIPTPSISPVDFLALKDQTKSFLKEFLSQLFVDTQISIPSVTESTQPLAQKITLRNRDSVEDVFRKAGAHEGLRAGLYYFINHVFKKDVERDVNGFVAWAVEISTEALGDNL